MQRKSVLWLGSLFLVLWVPMAGRAQGLISSSSGAYHGSMAGTSTAQAVDAPGALYWNPATISGLGGSEMVLGSNLILPDAHLGSTVPAGAFGPFGPATTQSGYTRSDSGLIPLTAAALVYQPENSMFTYGMGISTVAAGGVNYPGDPANPILAPKGPLNQFLLGPQNASIMILTMTPTVSAQLTDKLAVGVSPMIDVSMVSFDPAFFAPTSQAGLLQPREFPTGSHTRPFWGGGFRVGGTYRLAEHVVAGFSYTSPQWFETWRFQARDANGDPLEFSTQFTLPMIYSGGVAYDGIDRLLLAADVRYFDYRSTQLLGESVKDGGAGWDSIWAVSLGSRYKLTDNLSVQAGYLFNQNPVPSDLALFNTQLPCLTMHTLTAGSYLQLNEYIGMSVAYMHGFKNSITGSLLQARGTSTTLDMEYDAFALNLHVRFGPRCRPTVEQTTDWVNAPETQTK